MPEKRPSAKKAKPKSRHDHEKIASDSPPVKGNSEKNFATELAQRIEILAERAGSKNALDRALGVARGTIAYYTRAPFTVAGGEFLARLAEVTGCDPGWLLVGRGEPFPDDRTSTLEDLQRQLQRLMADLERAIQTSQTRAREVSGGK